MEEDKRIDGAALIHAASALASYNILAVDDDLRNLINEARKFLHYKFDKAMNGQA